MKIQLPKKLTAFLVTAMVFSLNAQSQIVYTDIIPDTTFLCTGNNTCTKTYHLDLNNDGTNDFDIVNYSNTSHTIKGRRVKITPQDGNSYITNSLNTVKKIFVNDTIELAQLWNDTTTQNLRFYHFGGSSIYTGEWINETDKYLGLELFVAGQVYFGWARLDVNVDSLFSTFTIKDYAYNLTPNQFILAGDTGSGFTGIIQIQNNTFSVVSFHKRIIISSGNNSPLSVIITIYNTMGQELKRTKSSNSKTEIDLSECSSGFYFITLQTNNAIETRKIYLN